MSTIPKSSISVISNPTYGELFVASIVILRYRRRAVALLAIPPLFGVFLLMTPLMGYRLGPVEILLALFCFACTPLGTALAVWGACRRNSKLTQGPFTYVFDSEGMQTSGAAFNQKIFWPAILRIRRSRRFLFIFVTPARAVCIPLREISDAQFFDDLRSIVGGRTDFN